MICKHLSYTFLYILPDIFLHALPVMIERWNFSSQAPKETREWPFIIRFPTESLLDTALFCVFCGIVYYLMVLMYEPKTASFVLDISRVSFQKGPICHA